jgi:class 3 adenylate cyclase
MVTFSVTQSEWIAAPAEKIWPAIADSALAGDLSGTGGYQAVDELQADGQVVRHAQGDKFAPMLTRWTEDLGEWVVPTYCRQFRKGTAGLSRYADFEMTLTPEADGTRVSVRVEMQVPGPLGWIINRLGIVQAKTRPILQMFFDMIEHHLRLDDSLPGGLLGAGGDAIAGLPFAPLPFTPPPLFPATARQLADACEKLQRQGHAADLVAQLSDFFAQAPATFLYRIRPLALAAAWRRSPEAVVDLCLDAHNVGFLALNWNVLCPRCRNDKAAKTDLRELPENVHCSTCNVDYERDFSHNVELTFTPEPWLRPLGSGQSCLMGAASVPHILVQRNVAPGAELWVQPSLAAGSYRLRTAQAGAEVDFDWDGVAAFPTIIAEEDQMLAGPAKGPSDGASGSVLLQNNTKRQLTFVIEELSWRRDALTGDQVIARAAFRRHCPEQLLRPGDDVAIANVVLLFTDLKSSTSLYENIGDTAAYNLVRDHFDYLGTAVEHHNGALVKTMGDAIMAAFASAEDALSAALEAQNGIASFNRERRDGGIVLKIGLHQGACIAVASNGIMDYFGSTVNLAARLQAESQGGDIVLSESFNDLLAAASKDAGLENYQISRESGQLRGIDEPVAYSRLTMRV